MVRRADEDTVVAHILNSHSNDFLSLLGGGANGSAAVDFVNNYFTADDTAESSDAYYDEGFTAHFEELEELNAHDDNTADRSNVDDSEAPPMFYDLAEELFPGVENESSGEASPSLPLSPPESSQSSNSVSSQDSTSSSPESCQPLLVGSQHLASSQSTSLPYPPTPVTSTADLYPKLTKFLQKGCGCKLDSGKQCSDLFTRDHYESTQDQIMELTSQQADLVILGHIMANIRSDDVGHRFNRASTSRTG